MERLRRPLDLGPEKNIIEDTSTRPTLRQQVGEFRSGRHFLQFVLRSLSAKIIGPRIGSAGSRC